MAASLPPPPLYKGIWAAPDVPNPEYEADDQLYLLKDLKYVGFELWQVSGLGGGRTSWIIPLPPPILPSRGAPTRSHAARRSR